MTITSPSSQISPATRGCCPSTFTVPKKRLAWHRMGQVPVKGEAEVGCIEHSSRNQTSGCVEMQPRTRDIGRKEPKSGETCTTWQEKRLAQWEGLLVRRTALI